MEFELITYIILATTPSDIEYIIHPLRINPLNINYERGVLGVLELLLACKDTRALFDPSPLLVCCYIYVFVYVSYEKFVCFKR